MYCNVELSDVLGSCIGLMYWAHVLGSCCQYIDIILQRIVCIS